MFNKEYKCLQNYGSLEIHHSSSPPDSGHFSNLVGWTILRVFGKANSRNLRFWAGDEVRKLYSKAKTALVLAVSWIFFCGCFPLQLFKFIGYVEKHNPSIRCLIREPVPLIACMKIFNMLLYPSLGSCRPVLLTAAVRCVPGAVTGKGAWVYLPWCVPHPGG